MMSISDEEFNLKECYQNLTSNDEARVLEGATYIRKALSVEKNPPIQETIDLGIGLILIKLLKSSNHLIQFESCWALTNIASGSSEQCLYLVKLDILPSLVMLLNSPHPDIIEQAIWALGNISGNDTNCRNLVLDSQTIPIIIELLVKNVTLPLSLLRNICWTLQNLCRGKPQPPFSKVSTLLLYFDRLLINNDEEIITDICWSLSWISDTTNENLNYILGFGNLVDKMIELLYHPNLSIQVPALRFVGNILTGDDNQTQRILNYKGVLPHFVSLLTHKKKNVRKESCWALSNALAGNQNQIQLLIDNNVFPSLLYLLDNETDLDVIKEGIWCLCNGIAGGNTKQILYFVQLNCIKYLAKILTTSKKLDSPVISTILDGVERILLVGRNMSGSDERNENPMVALFDDAEFPAILENLQLSPVATNENLDKIHIIIETYFDNGECENEMEFDFMDMKKLNIK